MFTGIIQTTGEVREFNRRQDDLQLLIAADGLDMTQVAIGDSIAVNGVCLTAAATTGDGFRADVSGETLAHTTLGDWQVGTAVNLELAMLPTTRLGGHLVSGHVDGVGEVKRRWTDGRSERFVIAVPSALSKYVAVKGSICVDGISLTVNALESDGFAVNGFEVNIVPHTLQATTMASYRPGQRVNLEVDIIARYLERLLQGESQPVSGVTLELLASRGFIK